jgi:hypothetical protein
LPLNNENPMTRLKPSERIKLELAIKGGASELLGSSHQCFILMTVNVAQTAGVEESGSKGLSSGIGRLSASVRAILCNEPRSVWSFVWLESSTGNPLSGAEHTLAPIA